MSTTGFDGEDEGARQARAAVVSARLRRAAGDATRWIADMVLPPQCLLSGEPVARHGDLSPAIWQQLHFIDAPMCSACGMPWESQISGQILCAACVAGEDHPKALVFAAGLDRIRSALRYDDKSSKLALLLKYADRLDVAQGLARLMAQAGRDLISDEDAILVPVPLHRKRLISRRYNQSAVLAAGLASLTGQQLRQDLMIRTRATPRQQGLSVKGRERNVRGAFDIRDKYKGQIKGAHIILIDDVLTTGSTLKACARRLKRAGASRVEALVLARVVPEGIGAI